MTPAGRFVKTAWAAAVAIAAIGACIVAVLPATASRLQRGGTPKVRVVDNDFSKSRLGIKEGNRVKFKWKSNNRNPHQIVLDRGPDGVDRKDFRSKLGESGITFKPKFRKPGAYELICIVHPEEMRIKVQVGRRKGR